MMFVNPIFLFGLAAVAIPVAVHLRNRRHVTRVQWGAMRFLREAVERNQRRMRLEDLLLLLLRVALVVFLSLALARPALSGSGHRWAAVTEPPVTAMVIVDVSASMQTKTSSEETRFSVALRAAGEALDRLPAGSRVALYTGSDRALPVIEQPSTSSSVVRSALSALKPTDRGTDAGRVLTDALAWARRQGDRGRCEIIYVTDAQRGATNPSAIADTLRSAKDIAHITLIPIDATGEANPGKANLAVQDLSTGATLAIAGRPVRVVATIANHSDTAASDVRVSLRMGDAATPALDEIVISEIPPRGSRPAAFFARLPTPGRHALTATIAQDQAPFDDARTLVLDARESVHILIAEGAPLRAADPASAPAFFLRQALSPATVASDNTPALKVDTVRPDELSSRALANVDILILAGISALSSDSVNAIKSHLDAGRSLIIFPSDSAHPEALAASLGDLLPATVESPQGDAASATPRATLARPSFDHPVTSLWSDAAAAALDTVHIYRALPIRPAEGARTLLSLSDSSPALIERNIHGGGKTIFFAIPANTAWSDLPLRPTVFVPLIHRLVAHLATSEDPTANRRAGDAAPIATPPAWAGKEAQFFAPTGAVPLLTQAELASTTAQISITPPLNLDTAGLYHLRCGDDQLLLATTPDPAESDLTPFDLKPLEGLATIAALGFTAQAGAAQPTDLFFPLALLVLVLALTETVLAFLFSRSK